MNEAIQKYLDLCEQKFKELEVVDKEKNKVTIPRKEDFLTNKNEMDLIKKYLVEKDELLNTALVTLFKSNSVVIDGVLSIRKDEFRKYRGQYKLGLQDVKEIVYEYCNYLTLKEEEKEILDFCFKLVTYDDYDDYRGLRDINNRWESKAHDLGKNYYIFDKDDDSFKSFRVINLYPDGNIEFTREENGSRYRYGRSSFDEEQLAMLIYNFKDEIKGMKESFDTDLKDMRIKLEGEVKDIREKCGKYLLVASLKSGVEK